MKAKIFVGPPRSGKSRVAGMIADFVGQDKVVMIQGRGFKFDNPFLFQYINEKTELLIIDDCLDNFKYEDFYACARFDHKGEINGFLFNCHGQGTPPLKITVKRIIFTTNKLKKKYFQEASFNRRFEVIDFPIDGLRQAQADND